MRSRVRSGSPGRPGGPAAPVAQPQGGVPLRERSTRASGIADTARRDASTPTGGGLHGSDPTGRRREDPLLGRLRARSADVRLRPHARGGRGGEEGFRGLPGRDQSPIPARDLWTPDPVIGPGAAGAEGGGGEGKGARLSGAGGP